MASENQIMAKLDFQRLADDTGLSSSDAARSQWRRLKAKLDDSVDGSPSVTPSNTSVTLKEVVKKKRNGKHARVEDESSIEDDVMEKRDVKKSAENEKRGRGRPRKAVVEKPKVVVPEVKVDAEEEYDEVVDDPEGKTWHGRLGEV